MTKNNIFCRGNPKKGRKKPLSTRERARKARKAILSKEIAITANSPATKSMNRKTASKVKIFSKIFLNDLAMYSNYHRSHHFLNPIDLLELKNSKNKTEKAQICLFFHL